MTLLMLESILCWLCVATIASSSSRFLHIQALQQSSSGDICTVDQHCLNDGKCLAVDYGYRECHCQDGYSGPRCSRFCPLTCQNDGHCTLTPQGGALGLQEQTPSYDPTDYMCKCFGHFAGDVCEIPYTNCGDQERCYNGGDCILGEDFTHQCQCPQGYSGVLCELYHGAEDISSNGTELKKSGKWGVSFFSIAVLSVGFLGLVSWVHHRRRRRRRHHHHHYHRQHLPNFIEFSVGDEEPSGIEEEGDNDNENNTERNRFKYDLKNPRSVRNLREEGSHIANGVMLTVI